MMQIQNLTITDTLTVAGITTLGSSGGITTTGGQLYVDTDLNVGGASTFTGLATSIMMLILMVTLNLIT